MTEPLFHYNARDVLVTFGEVLFEGFADDSHVSIEPAEDDTALYVGVDGAATRSMNNNNAATFTVVLSQSSPTNGLLSALSKLDRKTGQGVRPFMVKDKNGTALFLGAKTWIKRRPSREYGKTTKTRTWVFETHDLTDFDGGANPPPLPA
ncbi:MAG TPA: phage protein [Thermoanaerobaculia bacterium]|nr:phage protein [Thermoanaerobaculia bacterium]